jgi:type VI secretion system protein ImpF
MASPTAKDRLQPALFDRLSDEAATAAADLAAALRALDPLLSRTQRAALLTVLRDERADPTRRSALPELAAASLTEDSRALVERVLLLESARRQAVRQSLVLSPEQLRRSVLRDLQSLLNTSALETDLPDGGTTLSGFPLVQQSVLNYGIPPLAGRMRTDDDFRVLARQIEQTIERYEPRLRGVCVTVTPPDDGADEGADSGGGPSRGFVVEGELWGYPFPEHIWVRTLLDLDAGRIEVRAEDVRP